MPTNIVSGEDKVTEIKLDGLRHARKSTSSEKDGGSGKEKKSLPSQEQEETKFGYQATFGYRHPAAYERMAADQPGQELADQGAIWEIWREEGGERDQELVNARSSSLDMLLILASLFSAILVPFIVEAGKMLQPDTSSLLVSLLHFLAGSQYRIEHKIPVDLKEGSPTIPDFVAPSFARWINGLWFTSLGLSLAAALVAMLGKEWLAEFLSVRPRDPRRYVLYRHARLVELDRWWALHVIALLPSLLHSSLFLFAIGLIVYLWSIDSIIAGVLTAIMGATSLFYFTTTVLGVLYELCPFVTQGSTYLRRLVAAIYSKPSIESTLVGKNPTMEDLEALLWFANNARDPVIVDCSFEALSGLHHAEMMSTIDGVNSLNKGMCSIPRQLNSSNSLDSLAKQMMERFKRLAGDSVPLTSSVNTSAARHLNAILSLASHIRKAVQNEVNNPAVAHSAIKKFSTGLPVSPFLLLKESERFWSTNTQHFTPDTYANHLAIGAEILHLGALELMHQGSPPNDAVILHESHRPRRNYAQSQENSEMDLADIELSELELNTMDGVNNETEHPNSQAFNLRACYSRLLARISVLLYLHARGDLTIGSTILTRLLNGLTIIARCDELNPPNSVSTHHPQKGCSRYHFSIPLDGNSSYKDITTDNLNVGPLGTLQDLLLNQPGLSDESSLQVCLAIVKAYSAVAPVLFQQVMHLDRLALEEAFDMERWPHAPASNMSDIRFLVMRLMLLTMRYVALSRTTTPHHYRFLLIAARVMGKCCHHDSSAKSEGGHLALAHHSHDLIPIIQCAEQHSSDEDRSKQSFYFCLLNFAQLWITSERLTPCDNLLEPACFVALIRMIEPSGFPARGINTLLLSMARRMRLRYFDVRDDSIPWNGISSFHYLRCFTHTDASFTALARVASMKKYSKVAIPAIVEIVHLVAGGDPALILEETVLPAVAVPGFMDVVSAVAQYHSRASDNNDLLFKFSRDAFELVGIASEDPLSRTVLAGHPASQHLWNALRAIGDDNIALELVEMLSKAGAQLGIVFTEPDKEIPTEAPVEPQASTSSERKKKGKATVADDSSSSSDSDSSDDEDHSRLLEGLSRMQKLFEMLKDD